MSNVAKEWLMDPFEIWHKATAISLPEMDVVKGVSEPLSSLQNDARFSRTQEDLRAACLALWTLKIRPSPRPLTQDEEAMQLHILGPIRSMEAHFGPKRAMEIIEPIATYIQAVGFRAGLYGAEADKLLDPATAHLTNILRLQYSTTYKSYNKGITIPRRNSSQKAMSKSSTKQLIQWMDKDLHWTTSAPPTKSKHHTPATTKSTRGKGRTTSSRSTNKH